MKGLNRQKIEELKALIQLRYVAKCPERTLKIYGVPINSLKEFSADTSKHKVQNLPDDKYRLKDQEQSGTQDTQTIVFQSEEEEIDARFQERILSEGRIGSNYDDTLQDDM